MPNWNIFHKMGAVIISGATAFILAVENTFQINTANAYNSDIIPQLKSINMFNTCALRQKFVLISDHNINETYLATLIEGGIVSSFSFAVIDRVYPKLSSVMDCYFYESGNEQFRMGNHLTDVDRTEFLEYISNLEIINPYGDETEDLSVFEYIFNTYFQ